jgi:hypothetical protein
MTVKHPAPAPQKPQPQSSMGDANTKAGDSDLKVDSLTMPQNLTTESPQPHEDAELHLLPHKEKELDADLAIERDELLQRDNHMTSSGPKAWQVKGMNLKLSALEATVAVKRGVFTYDDFEL